MFPTMESNWLQQEKAIYINHIPGNSTKNYYQETSWHKFKTNICNNVTVKTVSVFITGFFHGGGETCAEVVMFMLSLEWSSLAFACLSFPCLTGKSTELVKY